MDLVEEQVGIYGASFRERGDSPRATFNIERTIQYLRFERPTSPLLRLGADCSIHDVGAGLRDLHGYLAEQRVKHVYSASEMVPEMVDYARKKYPGIEAFRWDIARAKVEDRHDFIVLSGVFEIPGRTERDVCIVSSSMCCARCTG